MGGAEDGPTAGIGAGPGLYDVSVTVSVSQSAQVGPYVLLRELAPGVLGSRWLVQHERTRENHVLYRVRLPDTVAERPGLRVEFERAWTQTMTAAARLRDAHILPVTAWGNDADGEPYAITPFTGDADGIVTLDRLLRLKGGSLSVEESKHALEQLLGAVQAAHAQGQVHGELSMSEIQVDRRGALFVELYGVARSLGLAARPAGQGPSFGDDQRTEVRAIAAIGYQLVTGLAVEHPVIRASNVVLGLDRSWDDYFETGLALHGSPGFRTAAHAATAVRSLRLLNTRSSVGRVSVLFRSLLQGR